MEGAEINQMIKMINIKYYVLIRYHKICMNNFVPVVLGSLLLCARLIRLTLGWGKGWGRGGGVYQAIMDRVVPIAFKSPDCVVDN